MEVAFYLGFQHLRVLLERLLNILQLLVCFENPRGLEECLKYVQVDQVLADLSEVVERYFEKVGGLTRCHNLDFFILLA